MARKRDEEESELKRENKRLQRQVARLRKELEQAGIEDSDPDAEPVKAAPEPEKCPKCYSTELGEIETPSGKKVTSCRSCKKYRSKPY
jgi:cell division septum initiation protein DivIVA